VAGSGTSDYEEVVLIERRADGTLRTRLVPVEDGRRIATFNWNPNIVAIFHTHPNAAQAKPTMVDRMVADKFQVPIYTLSSRGLWRYNPATRKVKRVMRGLDWLEPEAWAQADRIASRIE
jgi:hypothetical protein